VLPAEAKVGVFFLIALLLIGVIAMYLGDFWVKTSSYNITVYFQDIEGLPAGAEVRLAGVRIGKVVAVSLEPHKDFPGQPAAVKLAIFKNIILYESDQFTIEQGAILGDKCIRVDRPSKPPRQRLSQGGEISGGAAAGLMALTEETRSLVKEAREALAATQAVVASDYNKRALRTILSNVMSATGRADQVAAEALVLARALKQTAQTAGPDVARMAANLSQASESVKSTAQLVRTILATSPVPRDLALASGNVRRVSDDLSNISTNLAQVLATPETRGKLQDAMDNLHLSSSRLARITGEAEKLVGDQQMQADLKGALARLRESAEHVANVTRHADEVFTDPDFTNDVRETVRSVRRMSESGERVAQRAETSLEKVDATMERVTGVTRAMRPDSLRGRTTFYGAKSHGLQANFDLDMQYGDDPNDFWRVGVYDIGDGERMTLQRAFPTGKSSRVRVGLLGNKLAVGYDSQLSHRLGFEVEMRDPDDLHFNLRGIYGVGSRAEVIFGLQDIGEKADPFIGLRHQFKR
jgi:phospholipid/cholesterol/gamma-HCH transport system substrate-binding protein